MMNLMNLQDVQQLINSVVAKRELPVGKHMATIDGISKFAAKTTGVEYLKLHVTVDGLASELFIGSIDQFGTIVGRLMEASGLPQDRLAEVFGTVLPIWIQEKYSPESGKTYRNLWFKEPEAQEQVADQVPVTTTRRPNMADVK